MGDAIDPARLEDARAAARTAVRIARDRAAQTSLARRQRAVNSYVAGAMIACGFTAVSDRAVLDWLANNSNLKEILVPSPGDGIAQLVTLVVAADDSQSFPKVLDVTHFIAGLGYLEDNFPIWLARSEQAAFLIGWHGRGDHADRAVYDRQIEGIVQSLYDAGIERDLRRIAAETAAAATTGLHAAVVLRF